MDNKEDKIRIVGSVLLIIILGISCFLIFTKGNKKEEKKEQIQHNDVVVDDFTYSFLKLDANKENYIYSPLSIKYALSMLKEGANGNTLDELNKLLDNTTLTKYNNIDNILSLANSIFIRDTYKDDVKNDYIELLKENYNAEVFFDEFKNANNINNWISEKTFGIIKQMLTDDAVQDSSLKIALVNALAIDMEWSLPFENENTKESIFHKDSNEDLKVAMMSNSFDSELIGYYVDDDYSIVSLPLREYELTQLEFVALMPNSDLHELVTGDNFTSSLKDALSKISTEDNKIVTVKIPRFEFEFKMDLVSDLMTMGLKEVFDAQNANLTKIGDTGLYVSNIFHKSKIEFSEKGIKAAAATVIMVKDNAIAMPEPKDRIEITFDKPFMFIIRDKDTKEVWFVGTVYNPVLWESVKDNY